MPSSTGRRVRTRSITTMDSVQGIRTVSRILEAAEEDIEVLVDSLTLDEVKLLSDEGADDDAEQKRLDKRVKGIKAILLLYAQKNKKPKVNGHHGFYQCGPSTTTTTGTATEFASLLKKENKIHLFDELVTVKLGEAKKYLGEEVLKAHGFIKTETKELARMSLKKKK